MRRDGRGSLQQATEAVDPLLRGIRHDRAEAIGLQGIEETLVDREEFVGRGDDQALEHAARQQPADLAVERIEDDDDPRPGIPRQLLDLALQQQRRDRGADPARAEDAEVRDQELRHVGQHHQHPVAATQPEGEETIGELRRKAIEIAIGQRRAEVGQRGLIGVARDRLVEHLREGLIRVLELGGDPFAILRQPGLRRGRHRRITAPRRPFLRHAAPLRRHPRPFRRDQPTRRAHSFVTERQILPHTARSPVIQRARREGRLRRLACTA